jgi:surfactin synthase thioesterase subunit
LHVRPERENRADDPPYPDWTSAVEEAVVALMRLGPVPVTLFGHSLGALLAFETARALAAMGRPVTRLVVAGRAWPGLSGGAGHPNASDDDLLAALAGQYGPLPRSMTDPDVCDAVLPALRSDLTLLDGYRFEAAEPLAIPVVAVRGLDDPSVDEAGIAAWQAATRLPLRIEELAGGHYALAQQRDCLIELIATDPPQVGPASRK